VNCTLPKDAERRIPQDRNPQYICSYSSNSDIRTANWRNRFQPLAFTIHVSVDRSSRYWAWLVLTACGTSLLIINLVLTQLPSSYYYCV